MAEKIIIAELDIDTGEVVSNQRELLEEIERVKKEMKDYTAEVRKGNETSAEQRDAYIKNQAELKNLQRDYNANTRLLSSYDSLQKSNITTVHDARQAVADMDKVWAQTANVYGENSKEVEQLTEKQAELTDKLKEMEGATGNTRRNVGNYKSDIIGAAKETKGFSVFMDGASGKAAAMGDSVSALSPAAGVATKGVGMLNKAFKVLLANPIILIIAGIILIIKKLKDIIFSNQETMDAWQSVMAQVGAVMAVLRERVLAFVDGIKNLFSFNFKAFGKNMKEAFSGAGDEINEAMEAAKRYKELQIEIEVQSGKNKVSIAENRNEIAKQIIATRDMSLSYEERAAALKKAGDLEKENLQTTKDQLEQELLLAKMDLENTPKRQRTREQLLAVQEASAKLIDAETDSINRQREILNRENEARNAEMARRKAAAAERKKIRDQEEKEEADRIKKEEKERQDALKAESKSMQQRIEMFQLQNRTLIEGNELLTEEAIEEEGNRLASIQKMRMDHMQFQLDNELITQEEFNLQKLQLEIDTADQMQDYWTQYFQQVHDAEIESQELRKQAAATDAENRLEIYQGQLFAEYELRKAALEAERLLEVEEAEKTGADVQLVNEKYAKAQIDLESAVSAAKLQLASDFFGNMATIFGKSTAIGKAAATAQVAIDTYKGAQAAFSSLAGIPIVGPALGAVAAGAVVAMGAANIKKIWAVNSGLPGDKSGGGSSISANTGGGAFGGAGMGIDGSTGGTANGLNVEDTQETMKNAFVEAWTEAPNKNVLVSDEVTEKQSDQKAIEVQSTF